MIDRAQAAKRCSAVLAVFAFTVGLSVHASGTAELPDPIVELDGACQNRIFWPDSVSAGPSTGPRPGGTFGGQWTWNGP